jgi:hypothetical protein
MLSICWHDPCALFNIAAGFQLSANVITSTPIPTHTALTYHSKRDWITQGPRAVTQRNLGGDRNKYSPKRKPLSRVVARSNSYSYILE